MPWITREGKRVRIAISPESERARLAAYRERKRLEALKLKTPAMERAKARDRRRPATISEPACTAALALDFVKLLHAGIPLAEALTRIAGPYLLTLKPKGRRAWITAWCSQPAVAAATSAFCKSEWQELGRDERLQIALDKHCAEMAYFLYTHPYDRLDGLDLAKAKDARVTLMEMLKVSGGGDEGPFAQMVKELLAGSLSDTKPPTLSALPAPFVKTVVES